MVLNQATCKNIADFLRSYDLSFTSLQQWSITVKKLGCGENVNTVYFLLSPHPFQKTRKSAWSCSCWAGGHASRLSGISLHSVYKTSMYTFGECLHSSGCYDFQKNTFQNMSRVWTAASAYTRTTSVSVQFMN